jgi:phage-related protein
MAEVGTAFVTIVPSAKGFGSALNAQTGTAAAAAGTTSGKKFGGTFAGATKAFLKPLAGLFAVGAVTKGIQSMVAEAREAQKVGAITAQVIKTTGGAANVSAKQVEALATSLSNKAGVDDEVIQKGANLLLTFKNVRNEVGRGNNVFDQATKAAVDLSAAGFGSVDSASKMLGKALNDPIKGMTALGRAGVTFTKGQEKQIKALVKSGDLLGAQKIILGEVKSQVGGAAAASATAGEKMAVAWNNAKESIGTALLPAIDSIANTLRTKVIPAIVQFVGFLQQNSGAVKAIAVAVASLVAAFLTFKAIMLVVTAAVRAWTIAQIALNIALSLNPIGLIIIAIAALVAGLILAWKNSETFRNIVLGAWAAIKSFVIGAVSAVVGFIKKHWGLLVAIIGGPIGAAVVLVIKNWAKIKAFTSAAWNFVKTKIIGAIVGAVAKVRSGVADIIGFFKSLPGKIKSGLGNLGKLLIDKGKDLVRGFVRGITSLPGAIKDALLSLIPGPLRKFAAKLGLKSPSTVFRQYGEWTVEGFVQGIKRKAPTVSPAVQTIADRAILGGVGIGSRFNASGLATAGGPQSFSLVGARVEMGKDGFATFVDGRIVRSDLSAAQAVRFG